MNKITLEKIYSSGDSVHVKILFNSKDVGVLFLKEEEAELLIKALRLGASSADVDVFTDIFDEDDIFDGDIDE